MHAYKHNINTKYLYISSVDISMSNGPSVNEREFIISIYKAVGDNIKFLIPRFSNPKVQGLPIDSCIFSSRCSRGDRFRFLPHTITQLLYYTKLVRLFKPDLIIFRLGLFPISQYVISRRTRTPYVVKTTGPSLVNPFANCNLSKVLNKIQNHMITSILDKAIGIDCVSDLHKQQLKKLFPGVEILVVDNSVNTERFKVIEKNLCKKELGLERFRQIVGYAGNYPVSRGGKQLVSIADRILKENGNVGFVILGSDPKIDELKKLARELHLEDNVMIIGSVPFDQVPLWINTFDIGISFLSPEHSGASEQKVRQYLACGKPVVCSYGSSNFIKENHLGFIEKWDDLLGITNAVITLLNLKQDEYAKISQSCRQYSIINLSVEKQTSSRLKFWDSQSGLSVDEKASQLIIENCNDSSKRQC